MASIAGIAGSPCIAGSAAAQLPARLVEVSLTNAPFVLRDGRTALASVIEVGFAAGAVQPDSASTGQILDLVKQVGPACVRSMQVIGHADEAIGVGSTDNAIQARARADRLAAIIETDGLEPEKIARLWSSYSRSGAPGATIWVFVDGMKAECALASAAAMASATIQDTQILSAVDDGIGAVEMIEGQFGRQPLGVGAGETAVSPVPATAAPLAPPPAAAVSRRLDLSLAAPKATPMPARRPVPSAKAVSMGVDDGKAQSRTVRTSGTAQPTALVFADNSSYLSESAAKALDRLARDILAGPSCRLDLQGTVAVTGTTPEYARWLATRRMARVEEALRSRLPDRRLIFQQKLRERDDSRSVVVTSGVSADCKDAGQVARQVTAQATGPLPPK